MIPMAAVYDYEEFQKKGWPNVVLQLFTNFAFVAQLHVLAHAGANPENEFFNQSVVTCVFTGYLVVLLYCISASLDFLMLPRGFIPTLAFSFQLVNCIVIRADEGGAPVGGYSDEQKMVAIFLVVLNASAIAVMVMFRNLTRSDDEDAGLRNWPILRSVVLTLFSGAAALSIYEWSFTNSADRGVWCFSAMSAFTQFLIMAVVFNPSSASAGGTNDKTDKSSSKNQCSVRHEHLGHRQAGMSPSGGGGGGRQRGGGVTCVCGKSGGSAPASCRARHRQAGRTQLWVWGRVCGEGCHTRSECGWFLPSVFTHAVFERLERRDTHA